MENKKKLINKRIAYSKVKYNLEHLNSMEIIEIIDAETEEILNYRKQIDMLNHYSYPKLASKQIDKNNTIMIEWFFKEIPILKDNVIWIMPFDEMNLWWVKIKVINCKDIINNLWNKGEICIIEEVTKKCYYIQIYEDICNIVFKQLNS